MSYSWAIAYNNPFGLIQNPPDRWKGLIDHDQGRLKFKNNIYGVRAGFINLINGYLKKGLDTPREIIVKYAPKGHGANDPDQYIRLIAQFAGINGNDKIDTTQKLFSFGRAITRIERGSFLDTSDLTKGFEAALVSLGGQAPDFIVKGGTKTGKNGKFVLWMAAGIIGLVLLKNIK